GIGLLAGLLASLAAGRLVASLLFEVEAADPVSFLIAIALFLLAAALAMALPARQAARARAWDALRRKTAPDSIPACILPIPSRRRGRTRVGAREHDRAVPAQPGEQPPGGGRTRGPGGRGAPRRPHRGVVRGQPGRPAGPEHPEVRPRPRAA